MQFLRWGAVWFVFAAVHMTCMAVDWELRPKGSPMTGGLPEAVVTSIQWGSLGLLLVALFFWMPRSWPNWLKALLTIVQAVLAFFLMIGAWLYYVIENGIDAI